MGKTDYLRIPLRRRNPALIFLQRKYSVNKLGTFLFISFNNSSLLVLKLLFS